MIALARLAGSAGPSGGAVTLGAAGVGAAVHNMRERRPDRVNAAVRHYAAAALRREGSVAATQGLVDGLLMSRML